MLFRKKQKQSDPHTSELKARVKSLLHTEAATDSATQGSLGAFLSGDDVVTSRGSGASGTGRPPAQAGQPEPALDLEAEDALLRVELERYLKRRATGVSDEDPEDEDPEEGLLDASSWEQFPETAPFAAPDEFRPPPPPPQSF